MVALYGEAIRDENVVFQLSLRAVLEACATRCCEHYIARGVVHKILFFVDKSSSCCINALLLNVTSDVTSYVVTRDVTS